MFSIVAHAGDIAHGCVCGRKAEPKISFRIPNRRGQRDRTGRCCIHPCAVVEQSAFENFDRTPEPSFTYLLYDRAQFWNKRRRNLTFRKYFICIDPLSRNPVPRACWVDARVASAMINKCEVSSTISQVKLTDRA